MSITVFITKLTKLTLLSLSTIILLIFVTTFFCRKYITLEVPISKRTLIVGDSHTECSINDSIIPNCINLSQSGTGYFYTYVKLRSIINANPQIDTVVVGYSYDDVSAQKDAWFWGDESIKFKLRNYFFMFDLEDYFSLFKSNPVSVIMNTPQVIFHNVKILFYGISSLGGYLPLERNNLEESIKRRRQESINENEFSPYQRLYLLKIYELCQSRKINLVLINPPIYPVLEQYQDVLKSKYYEFAKRELSNAILVNHSNVKIPENGFSDLSHLNKKGAAIYSNLLKRSGFGKEI